MENNDDFYNKLKEMSDKIHKKTWDAIESHKGNYMEIPEWREAKAEEILIGEILREYEQSKKPKSDPPIEIKKDPISIVDYIDPMNTEHMKGYLHMQVHGAWSERFRAKMARDNVTFPEAWKQLIDTKLADHWIKRHLRSSEYENVMAGKE
jgi:hypothetical protein